MKNVNLLPDSISVDTLFTSLVSGFNVFICSRFKLFDGFYLIQIKNQPAQAIPLMRALSVVENTG